MSDDADFNAMIRSFERLADFPQRTALVAGPLVLKVQMGFTLAGRDPYGNPWIAKKDGGRPLVNAVKALSVTSFGTSVRVQLKGVEVVHNFGTQLGADRAKGRASNARAFAEGVEKTSQSASRRAIAKAKKADKPLPEARKASSVAQTLGRYHTPPRQIIPNPTDPMPPAYALALKEAADKTFLALVEGDAP